MLTSFLKRVLNEIKVNYQIDRLLCVELFFLQLIYTRDCFLYQANIILSLMTMIFSYSRFYYNIRNESSKKQGAVVLKSKICIL